MTNLDSILKSGDIALLTKVCIVKAIVFPVFMYGCESWTMKKAECWRTDGFELYWRRLLKVPWTARRSNQSILKEIQSWIFTGRTDAKAETLILWLPDVKCGLTGKDPDARKDWRREEKEVTEDDGYMASSTHWTWVWASSRWQWRTRKPGVLSSMGCQRRINWTTTISHFMWYNLIQTINIY